MKAMSTFIDRNKHIQDHSAPKDNRNYIMDEIFDDSKGKSQEKLDKATKYLRNLSFDANDKNSLVQNMEKAELSYELFHRKMENEQQERAERLAKRTNKKIVIKKENLSILFLNFLGKIDPYERNIIEKIEHKEPIGFKDIKMDYSVYYNYKSVSW